LSPWPAIPKTITLAKLGYRTRCFETRIRIAKAIAVCGAAPDPIIAQPVQCGIDLGDQIGCVDHFGGGVILFSTVNLERAVEEPTIARIAHQQYRRPTELA
jgi:hypothetical protein